MVRATIGALALMTLPFIAMAQDVPPADQAEASSASASDDAIPSDLTAAPDGAGGNDVATAVNRVTADFNARLVDYDQRIRSLEARVEALETEAGQPEKPVPAASGPGDAAPAGAASDAAVPAPN